MSVRTFGLLFLCLLSFTPIQAAAQTPGCNLTWQLNGCVGCRSVWGPSYKSANGGCAGCGGLCMSFAPADATGEKKQPAEIVTIADPNALSRQLVIPQHLVRDIATRNPWAANALLTLQEIGQEADLRHGTVLLEYLPTVESVNRILAGDQSAIKSSPLPAGTLARVSHRLDRGPGENAQIFLSAYTVDSEERMLFRVYPDITVNLIERSSEPSSSRGPARADGQDTLPAQLIARTWSATE